MKIKIIKDKEVKTPRNTNSTRMIRFHAERIRVEDRLRIKNERRVKNFFRMQRQRFLNDDRLKINPAEEIGLTIEMLTPILNEAINDGIIGGIKYYAPDKFVFNRNFVSQWLARVSRNEAVIINTTTVNQFEKVLKEGTQAGESIEQIKERINGVFDFATDTRSRMIARTETARGIVEGHRRTFKQLGFDKLFWILVDDEKTGELDRQLSQQEWNVDSIEGQQPVHPNCRCDFAPLI